MLQGRAALKGCERRQNGGVVHERRCSQRGDSALPSAPRHCWRFGGGLVSASGLHPRGFAGDRHRAARKRLELACTTVSDQVKYRSASTETTRAKRSGAAACGVECRCRRPAWHNEQAAGA